jgi:DNA-binding transcriptional regulator GbsR (MarR family)
VKFFDSYSKRGNGKPYRVRSKIKSFCKMSFPKLTDQEFAVFKQEALNHLAMKLSIDNNQETLGSKIKECNEVIYSKLEDYLNAYAKWNNHIHSSSIWEQVNSYITLKEKVQNIHSKYWQEFQLL